ncbi:two-component response regulatory protein [Vibrio orientalis CIP 102891 = ATCC 33934]|uniref:Two-component response regulatory protein n=1 Tax=Vibrio orientalis CIP 102891 = ATCC 33934 TaxID=675816 RepID=C9QGM3_VIBOR|nr:ANTAR domain-containing protein [Vibrio orientalis]EEX93833.1 putative two-component response regulatory protein [Vibrio orientalis CIP 102891 = ATCC 33934]EGU48282.1 two-component response regulatory protein [Vibrio orientalis CIP 102891 = ATCC 33934]
MYKKLSQNPIVVCSDRAEEQQRLSAELSRDFDNVSSCQLSQLELILDAQVQASVVIGWLQPSAELRLIIELCRQRNHPLLVVLKRLNSNDMNRLPEVKDYALLPADSQFPLVPWIEQAYITRQSISALESEIERLSIRLDERKLIEKAKGLLMKIHQVDEEAAYAAMRKSAMQSSQTLAQVARNLLQTLEVLR